MANPGQTVSNSHLSGVLRMEAYHNYDGVKSAAEVVLALAEALRAEIDGPQPGERQNTHPGATIRRVAGKLGLLDAVEEAFERPEAPQDGRVMQPTIGDDSGDAYKAAFAVAVMSAIDGDTVIGEHNGRKIESIDGTPVTYVLDDAGFSYP